MSYEFLHALILDLMRHAGPVPFIGLGALFSIVVIGGCSKLCKL